MATKKAGILSESPDTDFLFNVTVDGETAEAIIKRSPNNTGYKSTRSDGEAVDKDLDKGVDAYNDRHIHIDGENTTVVFDHKTGHVKINATGGGASDIAWLPDVSADGDLSWKRSSITTPPTTRNIKGADGQDATINGMNVLDIVDGDNTNIVVDPENKTLQINAIIPPMATELMFFGIENGIPVVGHDKPETEQTILPITRIEVPAEWNNVRSFYISESYQNAELEFIPNNIFNVIFRVRSARSVENVLFRLSMIDTSTNTTLAVGTGEINLADREEIQPLMITGKYEVPAIVGASDIRIDLQVRSAQFIEIGLSTIPPSDISFLSRFVSGTAIPGERGERGTGTWAITANVTDLNAATMRANQWQVGDMLQIDQSNRTIMGTSRSAYYKYEITALNRTANTITLASMGSFRGLQGTPGYNGADGEPGGLRTIWEGSEEVSSRSYISFNLNSIIGDPIWYAIESDGIVQLVFDGYGLEFNGVQNGDTVFPVQIGFMHGGSAVVITNYMSFVSYDGELYDTQVVAYYDPNNGDMEIWGIPDGDYRLRKIQVVEGYYV